MIVLGLSPLDKDSTVTLMEDGRILYAAAEERFTRVKLQDGFPWHALADAFSATGIKAEQIESVTYPFLPWEEETRLFERNLAAGRQYLGEGGTYQSGDQIRAAGERIKPRTEEVPGLRNPNERMEKSFVKTLAYKGLA